MRKCQDPIRRTSYLVALAKGATKSEAAATTDCNASMWHKECELDPEFGEAARFAYSELGCDYLEMEARRRAVDGVDKPVFHNGEQCGTVTQYSDTLLIFLMKARKPELYADTTRERRLQQTDETPAERDLTERLNKGRERVARERGTLRLVAGSDYESLPPSPDDEALQ